MVSLKGSPQAPKLKEAQLSDASASPRVVFSRSVSKRSSDLSLRGLLFTLLAQCSLRMIDDSIDHWRSRLCHIKQTFWMSTSKNQTFWEKFCFQVRHLSVPLCGCSLTSEAPDWLAIFGCSFRLDPFKEVDRICPAASYLSLKFAFIRFIAGRFSIFELDFLYAKWHDRGWAKDGRPPACLNRDLHIISIALTEPQKESWQEDTFCRCLRRSKLLKTPKNHQIEAPNHWYQTYWEFLLGVWDVSFQGRYVETCEHDRWHHAWVDFHWLGGACAARIGSLVDAC